MIEFGELTCQFNLLVRLAAAFSSDSLASIGGATASLPEIQTQVVDEFQLMDGATFANLVAIAQTAPGPNVLAVSMIGWHIAGLAGLAVSTLAIIIPSSLLALACGRAITRFTANFALFVAKKSLAPIAAGLMLASGYVLAGDAGHNELTIAITVATALMIVLTRLSPLWGMAMGAILGIAGGALGFSG